MEKLKLFLQQRRLETFLDGVAKVKVTQEDEVKPFYNQRDFKYWLQTITEDPVLEANACSITDPLEIAINLQNIPPYLGKQGLMPFELPAYAAGWSGKVSNVARLCGLGESGSISKSILIIPFSIGQRQSAVGHQNVILVDFQQRIYERFEPLVKFVKNFIAQGTDDQRYQIDYNESIDAFCRVELKRLLPFLQSFTYVSPMSACPRGLQKARHPGFCMVWSCLITHVRLMNPDVLTKDCTELLVDYISRWGSKNRIEDPFLEFIQKYAKIITKN